MSHARFNTSGNEKLGIVDNTQNQKDLCIVNHV